MKKVIGELVVDEKCIVKKVVTYTDKGIFKDTYTDREEVDWKATKDLQEKVAKANNIIPKDAELRFSAGMFVHPNDIGYIYAMSVPHTALFKVVKDFPTEEI